MNRQLPQNTLKRSQIIKKNAEILKILNNGVSFKNDCMKLVILKTQESNRCVAFLVKKRLGRKAVLRNKIKRYLREIYRQNKHLLPDSSSVLFMPSKPYIHLSFKKLERVFFEITTSEKYRCFYNKILSN